MKINPELLDKMAELEVDALLKGLSDEELKRNPQFLAKVRQFLKDNDLKTTPKTSVPLVKQITKEIPDFSMMEGDDADFVDPMDTRAN